MPSRCFGKKETLVVQDLPDKPGAKKPKVFHWLTVVLPFAVALQMVCLFWHLHYYRDPFRDEVYSHLLLVICAAAAISAWRWLDKCESSEKSGRFAVQRLFCCVPVLAIAYLLVLVCFLSISAAYATTPVGVTVEGFSRTADRMASFGLVYASLTVVLFVFVLPVAAALVFTVRMLIKRRKISREELSLILHVVVPVTLYLLLFPLLERMIYFCFMDSSSPRPSWIMSLQYFHPVAWLENPGLNFWLVPFCCLLVSWGLVNLVLVSRQVCARSDSDRDFRAKAA